MNDAELLARTQGKVDQLQTLKDAGLIAQGGHFFPCGIHYPPITMYPTTDQDQFLAGYNNPPDDEFVLYLHIPFCARRCTFCHYPVTTNASDGEKDGYLDLLLKEMDLWADRLGVKRFKARSILIAGGTPTELSPDQFRRFHDRLAERVDTTNCAQISYDVHPVDLLGDDGMERLRIMRDFGSDRLTLGLQSLDDRLLKHMNRGHTAEQAFEAIDKCREAGFSDLCIEFIFGYPDQSMDMWLKTVRDAIATDVEEIQLYRLKISPYGDSPGPIERLYRKHPERFAGAEEAIRMKRAAHILLNEAGYHENLTRVFTKKPAFTSHYATDQCCKLMDCVGFGLSAFSSLRDRFCINTASMHDYFEMVSSGKLPLNRGIVRSPDQQKRWSALLPLKNSWIPKDLYADRACGAQVEEVFGPQLDAMKRYGLIYEDDEIVRLTPEGRFFADEICAQLHHPRHLPFPATDYADGPLKLAQPLPGEEDSIEQVPVLRTRTGLLAPA